MTSDASDGELNAFVDAELGPREFEQIFGAIQRDAELRRQVAELQDIKMLVRCSYQETQALERSRPQVSRGRRLSAALVAMALLASGAAGWFGRDYLATNCVAGWRLLHAVPSSDRRATRGASQAADVALDAHHAALPSIRPAWRHLTPEPSIGVSLGGRGVC